jgi:lysophospholipid acyltransferase
MTIVTLASQTQNGWWWPLDAPVGPGATWLMPQAGWERAAAAVTGLEAANVRMLAALLAAYPMASLMRRVSSTPAKHALALVGGVLALVWVCDRAAVYPLLTVVVSYVVMRAAPSAHAPWLVMAATLAVLAFAHWRRMILSGEVAWDFSSPQMVLTIKLSSLAFELLDGVRLQRAGPAPPPPSSLAAGDPAGPRPPTPASGAAVTSALAAVGVVPHPRRQWKQERLERALLRRPTLLEFGGYSLFFGSVLVGPAFDYLEYSSSLSGAKYRRRGGALGTGAHRPSAERAYVWLLAQALSFLGAHLAVAHYFPMASLTTAAFLDGGNVASRAAWVFLCMLAERFKYYFVWLTAEGACMCAGFGWVYRTRGATREGTETEAQVPADLEGSWTGVSNVEPWAFERADSIRQLSVVWNKHTSTWLRRCVYERVSPPWNLLATYLASAAWHGYYPGYYLFFISAAAAQAVNVLLRQRVRPHFLEGAPLAPYKHVYDAAGVLAAAGIINYLGPAFQLRTVEATFAAWHALFYLGHLAIALVGAAALLVPRARAPPHLKSA